MKARKFLEEVCRATIGIGAVITFIFVFLVGRQPYNDFRLVAGILVVGLIGKVLLEES